MDNSSGEQTKNTWKTPAYVSVQKAALFCANTLVLKPSKGNKLKDPFARFHSDTGSLSPGALKWTVIFFLTAICGGEKGALRGLPSNIREGVIVNVWYSPRRRELRVTCSSLYFKRILKRLINKAPRLHNPVDNSSCPHFLVARDHIPSDSHKLYHRACKLVRQLAAQLFKDGQLHAVWVSPVAYLVDNKPTFVPRVSFVWYDDAPRTDPSETPARFSLLLHPGVRRSPDFIKKRDNFRGSTLQLESRLQIFPRQYGRAGPHWDKLFLAAIKRSLSAADLACSKTPFPLPPQDIGKFINPRVPFHNVSSCLTQASSVGLTQPPSSANPNDKKLSSAPSPSCPPPPSHNPSPSPPPPTSSPDSQPDLVEASPNENSCSHQSSDVPSPSPSPSDMGNSATPVLAVDEWPTILEAIRSHQQKSTPPSSSPAFDSGNKVSKLPPMMLLEYLDSGSGRDNSDCTPRHSVRLQKRVTDLSACA